MITATFLAIFFIPLFYVAIVQLFGRGRPEGAPPAAGTGRDGEA
jgi:hypothetical protein